MRTPIRKNSQDFDSMLAETVDKYYLYIVVFVGAFFFPYMTAVILFLQFTYPILNWVFDWKWGEKYSKGGEKLGLFGRLTHGWLWSDDPELGRIDQEISRGGAPPRTPLDEILDKKPPDDASGQ